MMDGIIVINKDKGMTSRDVVNIVSKKLNTKKVGHSGTLDPLATGVLIIGIGKYTKIFTLLENDQKEYIADILIGTSTDTLDITGSVIEEKKINNIDKKVLEEAIKSFKKKYWQEIPLYSAKKIKGKRLYKYARSKKTIELPKKEVEIFDIKLLDIYEKLGKLYFKIYTKVSKGTYIRSLINDISKNINIPMTMSDLNRISCGEFIIENSNNVNDDNYNFLLVKDIFDYPIYEMDEILYKKVTNGVAIDNIYNYDKVIFTYQGKDVAIYQKIDNKLKMLIKLN